MGQALMNHIINIGLSMARALRSSTDPAVDFMWDFTIIYAHFKGRWQSLINDKSSICVEISLNFLRQNSDINGCHGFSGIWRMAGSGC
jgi:hypothetical protein